MTEEQIKGLLEQDTGLLLNRLGKELSDGSENSGFFCFRSSHYRESAVSWLKNTESKLLNQSVKMLKSSDFTS